MSRQASLHAMELLRKAQALPAGERESFLAGRCGGDLALRRELLSLLKAADMAGDFFRSPTVERNEPERTPTPASPTAGVTVNTPRAGPSVRP